MQRCWITDVSQIFVNVHGCDMVWIFPKKKNATILFVIGFLVGFLAEFTLVERGLLTRILDNFPSGNTGSHLREPRIACVIYLKREHTENVEASERTWLKKCDESYVFRVRRGGEGRETRAGGKEVVERTGVSNVTARSAWGGLCKSLRLIKSSPCDWFIFSPDNLLVFVDNLKLFVKDVDFEGGHYYGHAIGHFEADFNVFSAGILLSRVALGKLLRQFRSEEECEASGKYWRNEDVYLGKHLKRIGILPRDTRDEDGRGRFHGFNINVLLSPGKLFKQSDYTRKALFPVLTGPNCCSPRLITIDATNSQRMYHHYYYTHKLDKSERRTGSYARPKPDGFHWKEFLKGEGYNDSVIDTMTAEEYYQIWAKKIPPEHLYEMMRKDFGS